jgi:uncharacterized membrane protein
VIALALARVVLLVFESCFLLLRAFGARPGPAVMGGLLVSLGGNPEAWITLRNQYLARGASGPWNWEGYAFWDPSRVIQGTVNEFPVWSAILGDFHAHHLALPWLVSWLAVLAAGDRWFGWRLHPRIGSVTARLCGFRRAGRDGVPRQSVEPSARDRRASGAGALAPTTPALRMEGRPAGARPDRIAPPVPRHSRHEPACAACGRGRRGSGMPLRLLPPEIRSTARELAGLWGFQLGLIALVAALRVSARDAGRAARGLAAAALGILVLQWALFSGATGRNEPGLYLLAFACLTAALAAGRRPWLTRPSAFAGVAVCVLLAGLEFFYIPDRMTGELARYNSYFKLSYPAWPLLSAVAWMAALRLWTRPLSANVRFGVGNAFALVAIGACGMLLFGVPARVLQARHGDAAPRRPTLDAFAWLANRPGYEAEAAMLEWIRNNVPPGMIVVEAAFPAGHPFSAYAYSGRVASLAGRPVPLGWPHHEAQWRGASVYETLAQRRDAVAALYGAPDAAAMRAAAAALGARWVLLGRTNANITVRKPSIRRSACSMRRPGCGRPFPPPGPRFTCSKSSTGP